MSIGSFQPKCLCLDLETAVESNVIHKVGAWRPDTNRHVLLTGKFSASEAVKKLNDLTSGAAFVLGHNITEHDLPVLRQWQPELHLLDLPVVDTLFLSPIAFPRNPYHSLVKDYKLVKDSRNDPLKDAQLALLLFRDQHDALKALAEGSPGELACQHFLLAGSGKGGLASLFMTLRRAPVPHIEEVRAHLGLLIADKVCGTRLGSLLGYDLIDAHNHHPLAYALAWLRVSGGNSVLPPWVAMQFPATRKLLRELRDTPCNRPSCGYCSTYHDPRAELARCFGFPAFRNEPANERGGSLQEDIVVAGMRGEHLLAILPTGGGKSLCYQLPALNRHWRNGSLTIVISPLQSLMKDQVDNLLRQGIFNGAALNGLLSLQERRDVLEKIRLGDIGILLVSPEQVRNTGFVEAIRYREIGAWVFDEAHCLSKWGHDFRPDYLYASRFIRERHKNELPHLACFTATAKPEVIAELIGHFKDNLGIDLQFFDGGHERKELHYEVLPTSKQEKFARVASLLEIELTGQAGGAIIFSSSRKRTEDLSAFLKEAGWPCGCFHAGLSPDRKKEVQQAFIRGDLRVIVATNAFGMGVDKPDVRVVIHAEIPGSLENYVQEAGRAGRDRQDARCILLYDEEDVETQFSLAARSRLSRKDIAEILGVLRRRSRRSEHGEVVITAGEILADEDIDTAIETENPDADTRVKIAVSWLERGRFLQRDENRTRVFPGCLKVPNLGEAEKLLAHANLSEEVRRKYLSLVSVLINTDSERGINTDELMLETGHSSEECIRVLQQLERLGILSNEIVIVVLLRKGVADASRERFERAARIEVALLTRLPELAPEAAEEGWQDVDLRALCHAVREDCGQDIVPDDLLTLLRAASQPFGNSEAERASFELRKVTGQCYRVRVRRAWSAIAEIADKRRAVAQALLDFFLARLPQEARGVDLPVEAKAGELCAALSADLTLTGRIRDEARALEQGLLYLHNVKALILERGRTVFRSAMTIHVLPEAKGRGFRQGDYVGLQEHYKERNLQIHVVQEYARLGLEKLADALAFVAAYFRWSKTRFVKQYFAGRRDLLEQATTAESLRRIVDDLKHPLQQALVADGSDANRLVLAGPGSGKTRIIVHRVAYLVRVQRVMADGIIVLTFNRHAALEIRRRLAALIGNDAYGVTVLTYHALAMRLTGLSIAGMEQGGEPVDFDAILRDAIDLLQGKAGSAADEPDELRERLLRGYRYVLVDEYQDIDALQYELVSALAGRTLTDRDAKLTLLAVGDDDQNIYEFRDADVRFIRQFRQDYDAPVDYLVENYRSSANIIVAANRLITGNAARLKVGHPIRVNVAREREPRGGRWENLDAITRGRVQRLAVPDNLNVQAQVVMDELARLHRLDPAVDWSDFAVLGRTRASLQPARAWCEVNGIPYTIGADARSGQPRLHQVREARQLLDLLTKSSHRAVRSGAPSRWVARRVREQPANPWLAMLRECMEEFALSWRLARTPASQVVESLYEYDSRSQVERGGLVLATVHGAKGREFKHVAMLDGGWDRGVHEAERRLYYVGMTRAKETLLLAEFEGRPNPFSTALDVGEEIFSNALEQWPAPRPDLERLYVELGLADVDISYAGRRSRSHGVHTAIALLKVGDEIVFVENQRDLRTTEGMTVGRLAKGRVLPEGRVLGAIVTALVSRTRQQVTDPAWRERCAVESWETVLCTLIVIPKD